MIVFVYTFLYPLLWVHPRTNPPASHRKTPRSAPFLWRVGETHQALNFWIIYHKIIFKNRKSPDQWRANAETWTLPSLHVHNRIRLSILDAQPEKCTIWLINKIKPMQNSRGTFPSVKFAQHSEWPANCPRPSQFPPQRPGIALWRPPDRRQVWLPGEPELLNDQL